MIARYLIGMGIAAGILMILATFAIVAKQKDRDAAQTRVSAMEAQLSAGKET